MNYAQQAAVLSDHDLAAELRKVEVYLREFVGPRMTNRRALILEAAMRIEGTPRRA